MSRADPLRIRDYLGHVVQGIDNILEYTSGLDEAAYLTDRKTQDAVIRNFEVIGEACNNVSQHHPDFAAEHSQVPWKFAYEMRNALAHGYFKIDHRIVWQTIKGDLPGLRSSVQALQDSFPAA